MFSFVHGQRRSQSEATVDPAAIHGWVPPDVRPSGAGRGLGTRVYCRLVTPSRMAPHRGGVSAEARGKPSALGGHARAIVWPDEVTATSWAMAHRKPITARALATTTW
jgi:hypothetical protein